MYSRFVAALCLFPLGVAALPSVASISVPAALALPTPVTTTNTVQTPNGTMTETCILAFTQVGQQIQEIQNCTIAMGGSQLTTTLVAASATASPTAAAAFVLPGTTLQVLPVGLGIYGGITSVAIFAVAFVTWERVQYRKAFRQARMVENRAANVFGGMTKG